MALIHQLVYEQNAPTGVDLAGYLARLCMLLNEGLGTQGNARRLKFESQGDSGKVGLDQAVPCALLVNELVVNALEHAFPDRNNGQISVTLLGHPGGSTKLVVEDDGIGIATGLNRGAGDTLGFQLIKRLVEQLLGSLQFDRSHGSRFEISFTISPREGP